MWCLLEMGECGGGSATGAVKGRALKVRILSGDVRQCDH